MYSFYVYSDIIIKSRGRIVNQVALHDRALLADFIFNLTLTGPKDRCELYKKAMYRFLEFWNDGEDTVTVKVGDFTMTVYKTDFVEPAADILELGRRERNPKKEIQAAAEKLTRALSYNNDPTKMYENLQNLMKEFPSLSERV